MFIHIIIRDQTARPTGLPRNFWGPRFCFSPLVKWWGKKGQNSFNELFISETVHPRALRKNIWTPGYIMRIILMGFFVRWSSSQLVVTLSQWSDGSWSLCNRKWPLSVK